MIRVHFGADGVYLRARMEDNAECMKVPIDAHVRSLEEIGGVPYLPCPSSSDGYWGVCGIESFTALWKSTRRSPI